MRTGSVAAGLLIAIWAGVGPASADPLKDDAIVRLAASHEPDVPLAVARLAAKQAGLSAVRKLLLARGRAAGLGRDWNAKAAEWQEAEARFLPGIDALIARRIEDPAWVQAIISEQAAKVLNAEEADEIATHFTTASGQEQRKVVEIKVLGELMLANYTFTDRIDDRVPGSESEYSRMQKVWWDREPFRSRNFDGDEGAARFGTRNPGVKYVKMLAFRGVEGMLAYIDAACVEVVKLVNQSASDADPFIETYRKRTAK
jgi:hypothetical protein